MKKRRQMAFSALLAAFVTAALWTHSVATGDPSIIAGRASVVDGDTIEIKGQRVRFWGIDAVEKRQPCFHDPRCATRIANALDEWLASSRPTSCRVRDRDRWGRFVAQCYRADGADVSRWLVSNGYALDWPKYSRGYYTKDQAPVDFAPPWDWRKAKKL
ncbi:thermonuclease family protein [Neoaquamicrobium sediminum]|uniref:thermonuclease family protein n=1 Tax=Neoaquamicrobium sediminum TaxID=1849104 RepID=UPI00403648A1